MLKTMNQTARAQALALARDATLVEGRIEEALATSWLLSTTAHDRSD